MFLTEEEVQIVTGLKQPHAQVQFLRKKLGIPAYKNAANQVVVYRGWLENYVCVFALIFEPKTVQICTLNCPGPTAVKLLTVLLKAASGRVESDMQKWVNIGCKSTLWAYS